MYLSLLAGGLLSGGFPPYHQIYLVPVSFAVLGLVLRNSAGWRRIRCVGIFGFTFYLLHVYWFLSFHVLALPLVLLVSVLYFGVYGTAFDYLGDNPWTIAGGWMALQFAIGAGFLAFPWSRIATALAAEPMLVQMVRFTGEILMGGIIVLTATALAYLDRSTGRWALVVGLLLLVPGMIYGYFRLDTLRLERTEQSVMLVQPNVMSTFNPADRTRNQAQVLRKVTKRHQSTDQLIVWPETAPPGYPFRPGDEGTKLRYRNPSEQTAYGSFIEDGNSLLAGFKLYDERPNRLDRLNGAVLINDTGVPLHFYTKRIMVPFGEYIPGMGRLELIEKLGRSIGTLGFRSGKIGGMLRVENNRRADGEPLQAAVQICYEDAFPAYVHNQVTRGANLLVNISNDSWSRSTAEHWQHFYRAKLRAVETGRTLLRNGNTGVSAMIDPLGRPHSLLAPFEQGAIKEKIFAPLEKSFIVNWYSTVSVLGTICFLLIGVITAR